MILVFCGGYWRNISCVAILPSFYKQWKKFKYKIL
ncbi:hypothetical protein M758_2G143100 [Ceratodon purpureus]|nr:hypothetical protein M758_2G143100 [Ceratodon purpureus]